MKLNEWQLVGLVVGAFAIVIAIDVFLQYQSNAEFRATFSKLPTANFGKSRAAQMIQQEMTPPQSTFTETYEDRPSEEG